MKDIKLSILAAAKIRFLRFGFQKTTIDEICRDCRISKRTLYQHFISKDDLFLNLLINELEQVKKILLTQLQDISLPLYQLPQLLLAISIQFHRDRFLLTIIKDEIMVSPFKSNSNFPLMVEKEITALIASVISEGKKQNQFRDLDETFAAYLGFKLLQSSISDNAFSFLPNKSDIGYHTRACIDLFVNGIVKK